MITSIRFIIRHKAFAAINITGLAIALVIALLTVSWQTWEAANNDPAKVLRYESVFDRNNQFRVNSDSYRRPFAGLTWAADID
ncbi:MAG: hypothetical protein AMS27_12190 [Bacteroides sp. SM23_62_1]|nr:MAG: hypothetical protein AMS27_12190 [Bacteroides sp. SM23_62_1]